MRTLLLLLATILSAICYYDSDITSTTSDINPRRWRKPGIGESLPVEYERIFRVVMYNPKPDDGGHLGFSHELYFGNGTRESLMATKIFLQTTGNNIPTVFMDVNEKPSGLPYDESQSLLVYYFSFITGGYIVELAYYPSGKAVTCTYDHPFKMTEMWFNETSLDAIDNMAYLGETFEELQVILKKIADERKAARESSSEEGNEGMGDSSEEEEANGNSGSPLEENKEASGRSTTEKAEETAGSSAQGEEQTVGSPLEEDGKTTGGPLEEDGQTTGGPTEKAEETTGDLITNVGTTMEENDEETTGSSTETAEATTGTLTEMAGTTTEGPEENDKETTGSSTKEYGQTTGGSTEKAEETSGTASEETGTTTAVPLDVDGQAAGEAAERPEDLTIGSSSEKAETTTGTPTMKTNESIGNVTTTTEGLMEKEGQTVGSTTEEVVTMMGKAAERR